MPHKTHTGLHNELKEAKKLVKINGVYSHYKNPSKLYKVIALGIQEATDKICVIYQAEYDHDLFFIRDLDSWIEKPLVEGQEVERFKRVTTQTQF